MIRFRNILIFIFLLLALTTNTYGNAGINILHKKIVIVANSVNPPYSYFDNDSNQVGFNIDIMSEIMKRLHQPYTLKLMTWPECLQAYKSHQADILIGMKYTESRAKEFLFGPSLSYIFICSVYRKEEVPITTVEALAKRKVCVVQNTQLQEILDSCKRHINYTTTQTTEEGIRKIANGEADAIITYRPVAQYIIKKDYGSLLTTSDLGLAPSEDRLVGHDQQLLNDISATMLKLKTDGTYDNITDKWLTDKYTLYSHYIIGALILLLITAIITFIFNRLLSMKVKKANQRIQKDDEIIRENAERMDMAIRASNVTLWEIDSDTMHIICFNSPIPELNGHIVTFEQLLKYSHPDDVKALQPYIDIVHQHKDTLLNMEARLKYPQDNEWHNCKLSGKTFRKDKTTGKVLSYTGFCMDVTNMIKIQKDLKEAKEKAEESDRLKSEFLANMSHEIRTPLNAIVGFSDLLQSVNEEEERKECYSIIDKNSHALLQLINDILDLSKIEAGVININKSYFDISDLLHVAFLSLNKLDIKPDISFSYEVPYNECIVYADQDRVLQIITNFVTNAFKYTEKGFVKMSYEVVEDGIKVIVEDSGKGIPADKLDSVFARFEKLGSLIQGTGLGLSICKAITDSCKGKIGVTSTLGKGSTFWAWFPTTVNIDPKI
jgi:ABC-type amino acid transport substrate-binding protein/nitrogen-specific signal transduction histidine kinase